MAKSIYFECYRGISGDMAAAAMIDAGADRNVLAASLESVPVKGFSTEISRVAKNGIDCCDFAVITDEESAGQHSNGKNKNFRQKSLPGNGKRRALFS